MASDFSIKNNQVAIRVCGVLILLGFIGVASVVWPPPLVQCFPLGDASLEVLNASLQHRQFLVELTELAAAGHVKAVEEVPNTLNIACDNLWEGKK